jgi:PPM family protein phosphatase
MTCLLISISASVPLTVTCCNRIPGKANKMWLFSRRKGATQKATPKDASADPTSANGTAGILQTAQEWQVSMALLSDPGCQRETNQDFGRLVYSAEDSVVGNKGLLAVVADGMGGYEGGEIASHLAVDVVCRTYCERAGEPGEVLAAAVSAANRAIFDAASKDSRLSEMGTTCTCLAISGSFGYAAHVGDSRLYLIRGGEIYQMTEDHSDVMELVRRGKLTLEEARRHPDQHILHRALGRHAEIEVSGWQDPLALQAEDRLVLCSDGLCGVVTDETIRTIALSNHPADACAALIEFARRRNAPDNVTVAVIHLAAESGIVYSPKETREAEVLADKVLADKVKD